ncbi:MAG: hypothetical protein FWD35_01035 [Oscillospiraceae bacterium]|nr:hypothetical protein [Oscillospiraceae bacterium]
MSRIVKERTMEKAKERAFGGGKINTVGLDDLIVIDSIDEITDEVDEADEDERDLLGDDDDFGDDDEDDDEDELIGFSSHTDDDDYGLEDSVYGLSDRDFD